jgi:SET domain
MPDDYQQAAQLVVEEFIPAYIEQSALPEKKALLLLNKNKTVSDLVFQLLPSTLEQVHVILQRHPTLRLLANANDDDNNDETDTNENDNEDEDSASSSSTLLVSSVAKTLAMHIAADRRTPEWIRQHGVCVEQLKSGPSTIAGAGQGAFAQFAIAAGDIVVPAPLLQVIDRMALRIYNKNNNKHSSNPDGTKNGFTEQLLVNYCLGHAESTLLLCPTTNAALINHDRHRVNAAFRWHSSSSSSTTSNSKYWNQTVDELWQGNGRGLRMDVIALRDIQVGEEVFIDYGPEWESAWNEHVQRTTSRKDVVVGPPRSSSMRTVEGLNAQMDIGDEFLSHNLRTTTTAAMTESPGIMTACQYYTTGDETHKNYQIANKDWRDLDDEELLRRYADRENGFFSKQDYQHHYDRSHWPCTVIRREDNKNNKQAHNNKAVHLRHLDPTNGTTTASSSSLYLVRIHQHPHLDDTSWEEHDVPRFVRGYPRSSIHFFAKPYGSDQSRPGAFRHPIGIPDQLFPSAWKNQKSR